MNIKLFAFKDWLLYVFLIPNIKKQYSKKLLIYFLSKSQEKCKHILPSISKTDINTLQIRDYVGHESLKFEINIYYS